MDSRRDEFHLKKTLPCYFSTQFWHFIALLPQNPDFPFLGNLWGKSLFPGKKWGTSECLSANLQTGNQTRFPINLKAMKHTIFPRFFKSKRGKMGKKNDIYNHISPFLLFCAACRKSWNRWIRYNETFSNPSSRFRFCMEKRSACLGWYFSR